MPTIKSLIRKWENVRSTGDMMTAAVQTAAALSRVHDVPQEVLMALDLIMGDGYESHGRAIYKVVSYLRSLEALECALA